MKEHIKISNLTQLNHPLFHVREQGHSTEKGKLFETVTNSNDFHSLEKNVNKLVDVNFISYRRKKLFPDVHQTYRI